MRSALWLWGVPLGLGAFGGALATGAPDDMAGALAVWGLVLIPVCLVLSAREPRDESRALLAIFLAAVFVRFGVALLVAYAAPSQFFALDDHKYTRYGIELAAHWAGEGPFPEIYGRLGYYAWNAFLFTLLGPSPLAPVFVNTVLGGVACLLAHSIARELGGPRAGLLAAGIAAFWPSLVLWSSLNLKDASAIFGLLLLLRGAQRLASRIALAPVLQLALGFFVVAMLRNYLAWVAGASVALAWLLPRLRTSPVVSLALLGAVGVMLGQVAPIQELAEEASFESIDRARRGLALGASAYLADADVSTPARALGFLPVGLVYFLLAPLPWQLFNSRQLFTLPEMLAWYALIPLVVLGLRDALRTRFAAAAPPAFFAAFASITYALVEGNLGTAYRHRAQVMVLFLLFAAVGAAGRRFALRPGALGARPAPVLESRA